MSQGRAGAMTRLAYGRVLLALGRAPEAVAALDELRAQAARLPRDLTAGVARLHAQLTGNPGRQGMAARASALLDRMRGGPARA